MSDKTYTRVSTYLERLEDRLEQIGGFYSYVDVTYQRIVIETPFIKLDTLKDDLARFFPPCVYGQPKAWQYSDDEATVRLVWEVPQPHERRERLRAAILNAGDTK